MASFITFTSQPGVSLLMFCVLCITVLHAQELNQADEECNGCWGHLDQVVDAVARSIANYYKHRAKNQWEIEDDGTEQPVAYFPHAIFRRSTSPSTSTECQSCWLVLRRLKSYAEENSSEEDVTNFRHIVKKTMLNNGWV
uniref:Saposin B-type domain-containing protein n=1 Tax=Arion vulgaris TaxID=1028688 RepID=A0A0B6Z947_9EUPU